MSAVVGDEVVILPGSDDPNWSHVLNAALSALNGTFCPGEEASRQQWLDAIHERGYPDAELLYLPVEGASWQRVIFRPGSPELDGLVGRVGSLL